MMGGHNGSEVSQFPGKTPEQRYRLSTVDGQGETTVVALTEPVGRIKHADIDTGYLSEVLLDLNHDKNESLFFSVRITT